MNYFIKYILLLFIVGTSFITGYGQDKADEGILFEDHVYLENIRAITWHRSDSVFAYPIIPLKSDIAMVLGFDDLDAEIKTYVYTVQHCDKNWNPTDIMQLEYLDGFEGERIRDVNFSSGTITPYAHYRLNIPNEEVSFKISGNYVLKIYEDEDEKRLALTRRFMIVEPKMGIQAELIYPFDVSKFETHHEIDFEVTHKNIKIPNPMKSVSVTVMQNGRWDNAITNLLPFVQKGDRLIYDFSDKIIFESSKEFRSLDMRTFRLLTQDLAAIEEYEDGYFVKLRLDKKREFQPYYNRFDVNGRFLIQNIDDASFSSDLKINGLFNFTHTDHNLRGDYAIARFTLDAPAEFYNADVYVIGGLTDWKLNEEFKMKYDSENFVYNADCLLKQGFYDYMYTVVPRNDKEKPSQLEVEGSWYETENDYTILVYFTPFGSQYDMLVAAYTINSLRDR